MSHLSRIIYSTKRILKGAALALSAALCGQTGLYAQTAVTCPQNINFAFGNFNNWRCYTGSVSSPGTTTVFAPWVLSGPVGGLTPTGVPATTGGSRHAITMGTPTDPYGGFPMVAPSGGLFSARIGNEETGAQAEMIRYSIHVPVGFNNYSFNFKYAVVLEDPGHSPYQQPRFTVTGYDSATGLPIPCATQTYVAGAGLPGFTY
ncbi:MAG: hypothetical protein JST27_11365, partial [Bacteroidetes bacterium]|nr:hypothetical protein [Bacteroidota bacterium]